MLQKNIGLLAFLSQLAQEGKSSQVDSTRNRRRWSAGGRLCPSRKGVTFLKNWIICICCERRKNDKTLKTISTFNNPSTAFAKRFWHFKLCYFLGWFWQLLKWGIFLGSSCPKLTWRFTVSSTFSSFCWIYSTFSQYIIVNFSLALLNLTYIIALPLHCRVPLALGLLWATLPLLLSSN